MLFIYLFISLYGHRPHMYLYRKMKICLHVYSKENVALAVLVRLGQGGADLGILPVLQRVLSQKKQSELWYVMRFDEIVKFNVD